eukprot:CAMPEP_0113569710 /NCGR_PEP_ID=MMETSP0015_2-20120614/24563_1 /TAXON_ID=2838 /ORGANISM="Odontella" /LENGTH=228 /DNA_ID=CAMNT_0000472407 /DNA_START=685 /DNA_END=1369 /DNA_ORIENTATION=+ /assembly_acc=CAM_ASM_000160
METVKAWFINHWLPFCERFKNRLEELGGQNSGIIEVFLDGKFWNKVWEGIAIYFVARKRFEKSRSELKASQHNTTAGAPIPIGDTSNTKPPPNKKQKDKAKPKVKHGNGTCYLYALYPPNKSKKASRKTPAGSGSNEPSGNRAKVPVQGEISRHDQQDNGNKADDKRFKSVNAPSNSAKSGEDRIIDLGGDYDSSLDKLSEAGSEREHHINSTATTNVQSGYATCGTQ